MAFQTSFLRDGEWVTETVSFQSALRQATATVVPAPSLEQYLQPPCCGILSRTIIKSPVVHWVLPVRLRSQAHNDIAFVGDRFVQISELRRDGQVHEVALKRDFGCRIRSSAVLGASFEHGLDGEASGGSDQPLKDDSTMLDTSNFSYAGPVRSLPPQLLVLMLESGDTVFLFLEEQLNTPPVFVLNTYALPREIPFLGYHLVADPSSRYMAAASPEGMLVLFEMEEMATLRAQYMAQGSLAPVKSVRLRFIPGVIHKLEFLHPHPDDDYHIILILIVIRREQRREDPVTRMVIYEWQVGESLEAVFAREKTGNRLPQEHKMPLLLIPLRFSAAFFTVSEEFIGIVKHCLSGSPVFESLCVDPPSQTGLHHGTRNPLWTAWARPFRRPKYFEKTDIIYLAREDGAIIHMEIEAMDLVPSVTNVGCLDTNINTAFATAFDIFSDILIIGGDSGPGGIWKLAPRTDLEQVSVLPNWSPVLDVTAAGCVTPIGDESTRRQARNSRSITPVQQSAKPYALFTTSGRGSKGSVTQWRWGMQGRIGLDIDYGEPIRSSWTFVSDSPGADGGLFVLLALPYSSAVLLFSEDMTQVRALTAQETPFDLTSRTLSACRSSHGIFIQVTETFITVVRGHESSRLAVEAVVPTAKLAAGNACCTGDTIVLSTYDVEGSRLHILRATEAGVQCSSSWGVRGDITCVSMLMSSGNMLVVTGSLWNEMPWISIYTLAGDTVSASAITHSNAAGTQGDPAQFSTQFESLTSVCLVRQNTAGEAFLATGTRCGYIVNVKITTGQQAEPIMLASQKIGTGGVEVSLASGTLNGATAVLACCDNALIMMTDFSWQDGMFHGTDAVWLTDANDVSMPSPLVHSACSLTHSLSGFSGYVPVMALAGSRLLLAEIWPHVGLVPRSISIEGTPTRVIYSQTWNCLIVALLRGDRPTLAFLDPKSGEEISFPSDKDGIPMDYITDLGHPGDRIYSLYEWLYMKDGKTFSFLLVATKDGRLLIVSVSRAKLKDQHSKQLRFWTRYKKAFSQPIYSVVGDDQGIIFCVGKTIRWEVLDLADKKLKFMGDHELDSPATSLRVDQGHLLALTTLHSLEVIDYKNRKGGDMILKHSDRVSRRTIHMIDVGGAALSRSGYPVTLLADQSGGVTGVWVPWGQRRKELHVVLEARLPTSVRRFIATPSLPLWRANGRHPRYGVLASTHDCSQILGISLDGSLQHFVLLGLKLWRFLFFIQNLSRRSPGFSRMAESRTAIVASEADDEDGDGEDDTAMADIGEEREQSPKNMHIDGNMLERCLERRLLEKIVRKGRRFILFRQRLDEIEGGQHTQHFRAEEMLEEERRERYFHLGYEILAYLMGPVF
ncbi:hypothetical protein CDD83_2975 [Cordyceps sp. RAO-2017]|nr:hypothetical protein CDD83_2975 [Cordyceps sp. RAO-2017]